LSTAREPSNNHSNFNHQNLYAVKKQDADTVEDVQAAAIEQLQSYLQQDAYLQGLGNLKAYVVVFVGNEGRFLEV